MTNITPEVYEIGRRASDIANTYIAHRSFDELKHKFIAFSLADGSHDGTLYDSKKDAVRKQRHEQQCFYFCFRNIGPGGTTPKDMAIFLDFHRKAYAAGNRLVDPDDQFGGREVIMTAARYDVSTGRIR